MRRSWDLAGQRESAMMERINKFGDKCVSVIIIPVVLQCDPNPLVTSAIYKNLGLEELYRKKQGLHAMFMMTQGRKKKRGKGGETCTFARIAEALLKDKLQHIKNF